MGVSLTPASTQENLDYTDDIYQTAVQPKEGHARPRVGLTIS